MSDEIRFYKGKFKVKILTESKGYWIVEALEQFEDEVDNKPVLVKMGERRIVPSNTLHKLQNMPGPVKEHSYELNMEKKLKKIVAEEDKAKKP
jgi:hypothetical protein